MKPLVDACEHGEMHTQRTLMVVAAAAGIVSAFLPWVSMGIISVSGVDGADGWLVIGLFGVPLIVGLAGGKHTPLSGGARASAILCGALGGALGVWKLADVSAMRDSDGVLARAIHAGAGLYLMVAAGGTLFILGVVKARDPRDPVPTGSSGTASACPACTECRGPTDFVAQYQRYFCLRCNRYA